MAEKILVVDDFETFRKRVEKDLRGEGFAVISAADGSEGRLLAKEAQPDIVLTDADMPGLDGHTLCRVLKKDPETKNLPVIIMSGEMVEERDVVAGLDGGADDYIIKPFTTKVLLARIRAVLRRFTDAPAKRANLKKFGVELDPGAREVRVEGKRVSLTRKEFDLLALFLNKPGRVLKANFLLEAIWGYDIAVYNDPHTVESHISSLRRKLGKKAAKKIVNVRGHGYKLES
jgi:two-component system alkaline phosphatase synthesis response regulator PhoP